MLWLGSHESICMALAIFWIAIATDVLDGIVARTCQQVTALGGFLDTFIDKLLVYALIFSPSLFGLYNPWLVLAAFSRDAFIGALRGHSAFQEQPLPANVWGKLKFGLQTMSITCGLLALMCPPEFRLRLTDGANWLLTLAVAISLPGASILIVTWHALVPKRISFAFLRQGSPVEKSQNHSNELPTSDLSYQRIGFIG